MNPRRIVLTLVLAALAALAVAAAASAVLTQTARTHFTVDRPGRSTGVVANMRVSDPAAPGAKPAAVRTVTITFPRGTRLNLGAPGIARCRATDKQLTTPFSATCPGASRIGHGTAVANIWPLQSSSTSTTGTVNETVDLYVRNSREAVFVLTPRTSPNLGFPVATMHATVSGRRVTIVVPRMVWGKLVDVVLVSLKLDVPARGSGHAALVTSGSCTRGRFVIGQHFAYAHHAPVDVSSTSRCR